MENVKYPLWSNRRELPRPGIPMIIILVIATAVLSAITSEGFGGMFCTGLAGCAFALLLTSVRGFIPWITLPLSFGAAFAMSGDVLLSLCVLLYVPVGIILSYCAFTQRSLSVTVAALTVAILVSMAALLTVSVTELYEGTIRQSYISFGSDVKKSLEEMFSLIKLPSADGEIYSLPEEAVSLLIETAVMILPSVIVVTCEMLAYITAKIFRALVKLCGPERLFAGRRYGITVSVPASLIYLLSLVVSFFATEASVIAYSAINLAYILMPACAVAGFNCILGKEGILRGRLSGSGRIIITVAAVFMILMSPISFIQMLSMFACIYTVYKAISSKRRDKNEG